MRGPPWRAPARRLFAAGSAALALLAFAPLSRADPGPLRERSPAGAPGPAEPDGSRAERACPPDVVSTPRAGAEALALSPLPRGFERRRRGPVLWVHPRSEAPRVEALEEVLEEHWGRLVRELGREVDRSMTIGLVRDPREMRAVAPAGHPPPRYAVGVAYPSAGLILLSIDSAGMGPRPDLERVLVHELSHVALDRAVGGRAVPRWFSEGLAVMQAGEQTLARERTLFGAYVDGELPPLRELDASFSGRAFEVDVAYAKSADLVAYLARGERGGRKLRRLIAGLRRGEPFGRALEKSHYVSIESLDREWSDYLRERYGSLPFVLGGGAIWALASVLLLLAWRKRRLEKRLKLRRMEREERALERLEAAVASELEGRSRAVADGDEDERASGDVEDAHEDVEAPEGDVARAAERDDSDFAGPMAPDEGVPRVVHRGRSHTLH